VAFLILGGVVLVFGVLGVSASSRHLSFPVASTASDPPSTPAVVATPGAVLSGQASTLTLSRNLSGGTPPYWCDWLRRPPGARTWSVFVSQFACSGSPSQSTGPLTDNSSAGVTWHFMLQVTDNESSPQTANSLPVAVTVNWLVVPPPALSPSQIDQSQFATVNIAVSWAASEGPPYEVALYDGSGTNCSPPTFLASQTVVTGTKASFTVSPSSNSATSFFYCAVVTDNAGHRVESSGTQFTVNQMLVAYISNSAPNIDNGTGIILNATATHGTSTILYQWYHGECSKGKPTGSPIPRATGLSYSTGTLTTIRPTMINVVNFSVVVTDSSTGQPPESECASAWVSVNPQLKLDVLAAHPTIDGGEPDTLTAKVTGGTPKIIAGASTYAYNWFSGGCSAKGPSLSTLSSYSPAPNPRNPENVTYSVKVRDFPTGKPQSSCKSFTITVNPALGAGLKLSPSADDSGQAMVVAAIVSPTGGTPPYEVRLTSGPSNSPCSADTVLVALASGSNPRYHLGQSPTSFNFSAPASTTPYCAQVTDSLGTTAYANYASVAQFTVNRVLVAWILPTHPIDRGQTIQLSAKSNGTGTPGYTYSWFAGLTCGNPILGKSLSSMSVTPVSTTSYSVRITDSTGAVSSCASTTIAVTVNQFVSTLTLSPSVIDSGQTPTIAAMIGWMNGTSTFSVLLYSGNSSTCSSDTTLVGNETGVASGPVSMPIPAPASTTYFCAIVTDRFSVTAVPYPVVLTVNPVLTAPIIFANPGSVAIGQSSSVVANSSFGGGTPPYDCLWQQRDPGAKGFVNMSAYPCTAGTLPTFTVKPSTSGAWAYELEVLDGVGASVYSPTATLSAGTLLRTSVAVKCAESSMKVGYVTNCRATVNGTSATMNGYVVWHASSGGIFVSAGDSDSCKLPPRHPFTCSIKFEPTVTSSAGSWIVVTAEYGGDSSNMPSVGRFSMTVIRRTTTTQVSCTLLSVTLSSPTTITCTAKVNGYHPTGVVAWAASGSGSVTFSATSCTLSTLSGGKCSVRLTGLQPGSITVTASYGGDPNNNGSTSPASEGKLTIKQT